jgi:uncharacterized protein
VGEVKTIRSTWYDYVALTLIIVGGINWGLVGAFGFNLVEALFGWAPLLVTLIYILVGVAAVYTIYYAATAEHQPGRTRETRTVRA